MCSYQMLDYGVRGRTARESENPLDDAPEECGRRLWLDLRTECPPPRRFDLDKTYEPPEHRSGNQS